MRPDQATNHPLQAGCRVRVLIPLPLSSTYEYRIPDGISVGLGDYVSVPLGNRTERGVIWGIGRDQVPEERLREITGIYKIPPMQPEMRDFIEWTASYTMSKLGSVLRMAMSVPTVFRPERTVTAYISVSDPVSVDPTVRMTNARARVLSVVEDGCPRKIGELAQAACVSPGVISGMARAGLLKPIQINPDPELPVIDVHRPGPILSDHQDRAAAELRNAVLEASKTGSEGFAVWVLDGVTGSGKTETYFEALAKCLERGLQALVLLPEIGLSVQWYSRFEERFGVRPLQWNSELSGSERRRTWLAIQAGHSAVVVGARSALYLPFSKLGVIIVDEEHDISFKQEEGVIYNARDMSVVRARISKIPVILASATPSLETMTNIQFGRYRRLHLPDRYGGATMPEIKLVDMRSEPQENEKWISLELQEKIRKALKSREQVLLYLNRRGYAPLTLCRRCGHRISCSECSSWLVEHRLKERLECHHCGFLSSIPDECPECGALQTLVACGPGVERIADEVARRYPDARTEIMTSDTIRAPSAALDLVTRVHKGEVDILIGTQILAKGYHFPDLTLVGVIDADLGLAGGDLRASERVYQTLHQVSGRAGRAEKPGFVILQTYQPENPLMKALSSGDREQFLEIEAEARKRYFMPPYGRLVSLIVSGPDRDLVDKASRELGKTRPYSDKITVLGPADAPLSLLRGRHRRRLLVKADRDVHLQAIIKSWLSKSSIPKGVRLQIDIDPYSFM